MEKIFYLCDGERENCKKRNCYKNGGDCRHTTDISHAMNFERQNFSTLIEFINDLELVAVEADYAAKEAALQAEIDNIEISHPGYDEYRYDLDMIGHDPHELAAYLSAVLQGYTRQSAQAELERVFDAQYQLTLTEEVEVRYRTETRTDSEGKAASERAKAAGYRPPVRKADSE